MSTALRDATQAAGTVDIFYFLCSIFNYREWRNHEPSFKASLTWQSSGSIKHQSPFNSASFQKTLPTGQGCQSWLHENQAGALKAQSLCLPSDTTGGASPPGGTWWKSWCRWGITFKLFKLLSEFLPVLKKEKKKNFFKSSCNLFLFFKLSNSLL